MNKDLLALMRDELGRHQQKVRALEAAIAALEEAEPVAAAPRGPRVRKKRGGAKKPGRPAKASLPRTLSVKEAVAYTGLHQTTLSKMKREGVVHGARGVFDRESLDLMLEARLAERKAELELKK